MATLVKAAVALHNFLGPDVQDCPRKKHPGTVEDAKLLRLPPCRAYYGATAAEMRDQFCNYFNGSGALAWQDEFPYCNIEKFRQKS